MGALTNAKSFAVGYYEQKNKLEEELGHSISNKEFEEKYYNYGGGQR